MPVPLHPLDPRDPLERAIPPERRVYANRTLNLRAIRAIGYDMDYTLVQYRSDEWERAAFDHARTLLAERGWPVDELVFDPAAFVQGLVFDLELGNLVKATRFGYVIRAQHGTRPLPFDELRSVYAREYVDLGEPRWDFLNTLFSLSEACLYAQLVDLADRKALPEVVGYDDLSRVVTDALDRSHTEGDLKARIIADPERYVELDPDLPLTLLDQRHAGRTLLLITNSDWSYTKAMMTCSIDRFLPEGRPGGTCSTSSSSRPASRCSSPAASPCTAWSTRTRACCSPTGDRCRRATCTPAATPAWSSRAWASPAPTSSTSATTSSATCT